MLTLSLRTYHVPSGAALPPASLSRCGLLLNPRRMRQDHGRRQFLACERCGGVGLVGAVREGGQDQICEECSGSGRAR